MKQNRPVNTIMDEHDMRLFSFVKRNKISIVVSMICILVAYGLKLFSLSQSHDVEAIISVPDSLYYSWVSLGRFGLLILKRCLDLYRFNPYLAAMLMFLSITAGVIMWQYVFYYLTPNKKNYEKRSWIFPIFFYTAPIMGEQLSFMLQSFEICFVLMLLAIILLILWKGFIERKFWYGIFSVGLLTFTFSCYQSMVPLFIAGAIATFLLYYSRQERQWTSIFWLIGHFGISYIIYFAANKFVLHRLNIEETDYLTSQILWGKESISTCLQNIGDHIRDALLCENIYFSGAFTFSIILGIIMVVIMARRKMKLVWLYGLSFFVLFLTPFLMTILMGNRPTYRAQIILPFVFGFVIQYFAGEWDNWDRIKRSVIRYALPIICIVFMYQQINIVANMFYSEYVQYEEDVRLAVKISDRIDQLNMGEVPEAPVVFLGARTPRLNNSADHSYENPGHSYYEWSFSTMNGTFMMQNFMSMIGYPYHMPTEEHVAIAEREGISMPVWPDTGSVAYKEGVIIVKLS